MVVGTNVRIRRFSHRCFHAISVTYFLIEVPPLAPSSKRFIANIWCALVPLLALRSLKGARQTDSAAPLLRPLRQGLVFLPGDKSEIEAQQEKDGMGNGAPAADLRREDEACS